MKRIIRPFVALILGGTCGSLATFTAVNRTPPGPPVIAFVPRTAGTNYTEDMHRGALAAAHAAGYRVYWNAATREDDLDRQILIAENAVRNGAKLSRQTQASHLALEQLQSFDYIGLNWTSKWGICTEDSQVPSFMDERGCKFALRNSESQAH